MKKRKSLFKWIGGKKWLQKDLQAIFSRKINNPDIDTYIEPFCGGLGSILSNLEFFKENGVKKIIANDINSGLIGLYKNIQNNPKKLIDAYHKIELKYSKKIPKKAESLNPTKDKEEIRELLINAQKYYAKCKDDFNNIKEKKSTSVECSALFLFLMNHCFNGVYRENLSGKFNTPYNWECKIIKTEETEENILFHSKIFNEIEFVFTNMGAIEFISTHISFSKNAFFYFDPPYLNDKNKVENKYNKNGFNYSDQINTLKTLLKLDNFVYSNHNLDVFVEFVQQNKLESKIVYRSNVMNSLSENRGKKVAEILIY